MEKQNFNIVSYQLSTCLDYFQPSRWLEMSFRYICQFSELFYGSQGKHQILDRDEILEIKFIVIPLNLL